MKQVIIAGALALPSEAAFADPLKQARMLECEVMQAAYIGEDGMRDETHPGLVSAGETFILDTETGEIDGLWVRSLKDEVVVVMRPAETDNSVTYSATGPRTNHLDIPFRNIHLMVIDFSFRFGRVAPFTFTGNGSEVLNGICRVAQA